MQALTLPASRGLRWLSEGFRIFRKKQLLLTLLIVGYWVAMIVISSLPFFGQIVATLLIPVFSVSLMNAFRLVERNALLPPHLLFSGFQQNLRTLLVRGVSTVGPDSGHLACGDSGAGRMSEPEAIVQAVCDLLCRARDMEGLREPGSQPCACR